jgi:outer membrane receptor for ferrienterochelin and colicin
MGMAQTGKIVGKVVDKKNGEVIIGATIVIMGTTTGAATDQDGNYVIDNVAPGTYKLQVRYLSYKTIEISDVVVTAGKTTTINVSMVPDEDMKIDEVVIVTSRMTNTESAVIMEMKKADMVVSGISAMQIQKSQDRDASEVARRIPGVTVVDNRFVIVRGLSERYNAVMLNNAFAPSVETDVKAFSFDLVPSAMIEKFMIYKSPSPDLPGEFAGGTIKIFTRNIPEQTGIQVGYQTSYRAGTTFQDFSLNKGSKTDWLGFDNGLRALPDGFPTNVRDIPEEDTARLNSVGRSLINNWGYETKKAIPDQRFNFTINGKKETSRFRFGNITSINYTNSRINFLSSRLDYNTWDSIAQASDTVFYYQDNIFQNRVRVGVLQNNAFIIGKEGNHKIELKNLLNQDGLNETTLRNGRNYEEGTYRKEYSYRYMQRTILTSQLSGAHEFEKTKSKIDWTTSYSMSRRQDPDWRRARYTKEVGADEMSPYYAYVSFSAQPFYMGRLYFNTKEDIVMGALNYEQRFQFARWEKFVPGFKVGTYIEKKTREFNVRNIGYATGSLTGFDYEITRQPIDSIFRPENINVGTGLKLDEDTKKADAYRAGNFNRSYYGMLMLPLWKFNLTGGVRVEDNIQTLNGNRFNGEEVVVNNHIVSVLPSVNLTFNITEKWLLRVGYGKTLNRPEFREMAPFYFYDFVFNAINTGNDSLKTATAQNMDFRIEYYPSSGEIISAGVFYKRFKDPIETFFVPGVGSGGTRSFTWGNAYAATNYGVEIEFRKSLLSWLPYTKFLRNFSIVANAAWIKSRIELSEDFIGRAENIRPMMGQSPYVINTGLYYQNDSIKLSANLLWNVVGPRIVIIGIPGIPEVWEMPRHVLDFIITKGIGKHLEIRFGIQDILNQDFLLLQDANGDGKLSRTTDQRMQAFKRGSYYTLGLIFRLDKRT